MRLAVWFRWVFAIRITFILRDIQHSTHSLNHLLIDENQSKSSDDFVGPKRMAICGMHVLRCTNILQNYIFDFSSSDSVWWKAMTLSLHDLNLINSTENLNKFVNSILNWFSPARMFFGKVIVLYACIFSNDYLHNICVVRRKSEKTMERISHKFKSYSSISFMHFLIDERTIERTANRWRSAPLKLCRMAIKKEEEKVLMLKRSTKTAAQHQYVNAAGEVFARIRACAFVCLENRK